MCVCINTYTHTQTTDGCYIVTCVMLNSLFMY